ncbi:MAG: hypothetical protein F6J93_32890 [Oscillatoria sp. SIO1A7]|nr:hypothetical protein [Oscillatoria sp. SIO1A7]
MFSSKRAQKGFVCIAAPLGVRRQRSIASYLYRIWYENSPMPDAQCPMPNS